MPHGHSLEDVDMLTGDESWEKWKAFCYDWWDKWKIETGAICDTKKRVSEVFRNNDGLGVLYLRGVTLKMTR